MAKTDPKGDNPTETRGTPAPPEPLNDTTIRFIDWLGKHYIRLTGVWCGIYSDQRDSRNYQTTEQLWEQWNKFNNTSK